MMSENEIVLLSGKLAANAWKRIRNRDRGNELNRTLYENMIGTEMCDLLLKMRSEAEQCEKQAAEDREKLQSTDRLLRNSTRILHDVLKMETIDSALRDKVEKFLGLKVKKKQLTVQKKEAVALNDSTQKTV